MWGLQENYTLISQVIGIYSVPIALSTQELNLKQMEVKIFNF